MRIKRLNGMFTIANQMEIEKVKKVADRGYKTIICNRPDGEAEDQPSFVEITALAHQFGLETVYIPIDLSGAKPSDHEAFAKAIETMPKPILAYCRSGTRSSTLWSNWEHSVSEYEGGERRVEAMQAGALARGNTSLDGRRALPPEGATAGQATQRVWVVEGQTGQADHQHMGR